MKSTLYRSLAIAAALGLTSGCSTLSNVIFPPSDSDELSRASSVPTSMDSSNGGTAVSLEGVSIESVLNEGETLWSFAERTTGSGFNWQQIAQLNGIDDEKAVTAGTVLTVPPELAVESMVNN